MINLKDNSTGKKGAEVFTASMNDIMFFLMLFFIITSTLLNPHVVKLNLPGANHSQEIHKQQITLSIDQSRHYYINDKPVAFNLLESTLSEEIGDNKNAYVVLRCDSSLSIQQLVDVLEIGNKLNVKMTLATQKRKP